MTDIVVVGSLNVDVVVPLDELPAAGQTVLSAADHSRAGGGKGANQAVAAARLGRSVAMVGAVGEDPEGEWLTGLLAAEGVDTSAVLRAPRPTGQAIVLVTADGDSTIAVSSGANMWLAPEHLRPYADLIGDAAAVLLQQEVDAAVVAAVVAAARGLVVVNPAPARPIDAETLARVDVLVPNRGELAALAGAAVPAGGGTGDVAALATMARSLGTRGPVVVTLGVDGALVVTADREHLVPAERVDAVDATGAGDTFCAALADALLDGAAIEDAARWASRAAAVTVTRPGAMASAPRRAEVLTVG
ncbi:ribokinase [Solwaraspora sp. WMMA2080]|uniref:ribokinase n=1 Tax=unclassified Solwaraspora TaxID=2627926 RepID=UPI00248BF824|nr:MULTISPECIES: ribokinase [unclassified Solwaraspora]WBB95498.1 ribokinase [Solwaraspora sp. WMMA2059]WBC20597.1 ribokinase [Solwaraspora sp. WMMA2080]